MSGNQHIKVATKAEDQLNIFCSTLHLDVKAKELFQNVVGPCLGNIGSQWESWVTDDHSPYDWSVSITKSNFIPRIVYEPQGNQPSLHFMKQASEEHLRKLYDHFPNLNQDCLDPIKSLIEKEGRNSWFATEFTGKNHYKIYTFFAQQHTYLEALSKMGYANNVDLILKTFHQQKFVFEGLSFDLDNSRDKRVKFYLRFMDGIRDYSNFAELVNSCCQVKDPLVASFLCEFVPKSPVQLVKKRYYQEDYFPSNFLIAFVLTEKVQEMALTAKIHVPVRFYYENDAILLEKVVSWIQKNISEKQAMAYKEIVERLASNHRKLEEKTGIQSLVAFSCLEKGNPELSVYLSPELYYKSDKNNE